MWQGPLIKIDSFRHEIPQSYKAGMRTSGIIYATNKMIASIRRDDSIEQVANVATMPGIIGKSMAMPDIHSGYGFPIGGVAAFNAEDGVISPGGVGYDINCGVRLIKTNLAIKEVQPKIKELIDMIFVEVPSGVGSRGKLRVTIQELDEVLEQGAKWAVEKGYGWQEDLEFLEESGCMKDADATKVSREAKSRGSPQLGTLGAGNHFLELERVDEIYDFDKAKVLGIEQKDQILVLVHTGSRGCGHQICTDHLRELERAVRKYNIILPDRQLACAPAQSIEAQNYFKAMCCGANYAWANRQMITHWTRESFEKIFRRNSEELDMHIVYDVAHNIAKLEEHDYEGKRRKLYVHRKGATRAFSKGHKEITDKYRSIGQPVLIPGDMGTASYVLVGTEVGMKETFGSTCFTGDTEIITNKGVLSLQEVYNRFKAGENFLTLSVNDSLKVCWRTVTDVMKRFAKVSEYSVSQRGYSKSSIITATPDHKFAVINGLKLGYKEIERIVGGNEMVCGIDSIQSLADTHAPAMGYLVGALVTDGHIYLTKRHGKITLTQEKTAEKSEFINYVQKCFENVFNTPLREYRTRTGGGVIRDKSMCGTATDFICTKKGPAEQLVKITKNLPEWVLSLDEETTLEFLAGVIDGDGTFNPRHKVIDIFTADPDVVRAIVIACMRLNILPYISKQRGNCFIVQISEKFDLIFSKTKRVHGSIDKKKYGAKLLAIRQILQGVENIKWHFKPKIERNTMMDVEKISKYLNQFNGQVKDELLKIIGSNIRMQRVKKLRDLDYQEVYNLSVEDYHNYIVFTRTFMPILVRNCHGSGRLMSRSEAIRRFRIDFVKNLMQQRNIYARAASKDVLCEEAPEAYKRVDDVVEAVHGAGISLKVARLKPIGVMKG